MPLDWATLRSLAGIDDPAGVLSIYVTLDRQDRMQQGTSPAWELRMRHALDRVQDQLKQNGPREHWRLFTGRREQLAPDLRQLVEPANTGVGRALFAPLSGGPARTVNLQVPLEDRVVYEPRAYIRPLVAAWSQAGPAGAAAISAEGVRVTDLRFGFTEVLAVIDYVNRIEQRELKGPAAANPALAQGSAPQHDLYERREDDKLFRFLRTVGPRLADLAKEREWGYLALTGEATLVQAVREGLPPAVPAQVLSLDHPVSSAPPAKLAATVEPTISRARRDYHRELAQRALDHASSANNGTSGLGDTLGALQEGRVAHLLLDAERGWSGTRTPEGWLAPAGEVPYGADKSTLEPEPRLGERMIELALDSSAEVTILEPEQAAPLADADGVGAILRW